MARDQLSAADARARISAQWPLQRKRELADRVIDNRGGPHQLGAQVRDALALLAGCPEGLNPSVSD